jgi:hypothetical protein
MDKQTNEITAPSRTVLDPDTDHEERGAWVAPLKCGGCGSRVDTFYNLNGPRDARCAGCGETWTVGTT